ncbi:MAG: response regulator, partial [Oscillospiraceae bacterium]|nr:response regulator [Oscillospiraceae bacterium]
FQQVNTKKNREIEGTGLGLSITKNLVSMMDGSITVESEYGKGSTFTAIIWQKISDSSYISGNAAVAAVGDDEKNEILYAPNARVLVVDDNKVNLNVTSHILSMYGINAVTAESGREAIEKIDSGYYDLVFMDHMMPEMDGVDTTKMIRGQGDAYSKELPIVALTANAVNGAKEMFLRSGFNDFISKPIQLPQLEKILAHWLPKQMVSYVEANKSRQSDDSHVNMMNMMDIAGGSNAEHEEEILIPDVDVEAGLNLCGNSTDAYLAVLKTFMETAEESIERIERFSLERNYKDYVTEVHGLKSSALAIGANGLSEMARQLEMAGREENYKQIMYDTPTLIAKYTEVAENIKPFTEVEKSENGGEKPPVDMTFMRTSLEEALEAIDNLDSPETLRILDSLLEYSFPSEDIYSELENCRRYTDNFAYEKAEAGIRHILETV